MITRDREAADRAARADLGQLPGGAPAPARQGAAQAHVARPAVAPVRRDGGEAPRRGAHRLDRAPPPRALALRDGRILRRPPLDLGGLTLQYIAKLYSGLESAERQRLGTMLQIAAKAEGAAPPSFAVGGTSAAAAAAAAATTTAAAPAKAADEAAAAAPAVETRSFGVQTEAAAEAASPAAAAAASTTRRWRWRHSSNGRSLLQKMAVAASCPSRPSSRLVRTPSRRRSRRRRARAGRRAAGRRADARAPQARERRQAEGHGGEPRGALVGPRRRHAPKSAAAALFATLCGVQAVPFVETRARRASSSSSDSSTRRKRRSACGGSSATTARWRASMAAPTTSPSCCARSRPTSAAPTRWASSSTRS